MTKYHEILYKKEPARERIWHLGREFRNCGSVLLVLGVLNDGVAMEKVVGLVGLVTHTHNGFSRTIDQTIALNLASPYGPNLVIVGVLVQADGGEALQKHVTRRIGSCGTAGGNVLRDKIGVVDTQSVSTLQCRPRSPNNATSFRSNFQQFSRHDDFLLFLV